MQSQIILFLSLYLLFGLLELRFPAERGHTLSGRAKNILYAAIATTGVVLVTAIYALLPFEFRTLPDRGLLVSFLLAVAYIFMTDLLFYWYHRAEHKFRNMWLIHELHHSEDQLNVTTSLRAYWLERPLQAIATAIPITYIIGIDHWALIIYPILFTTWLFFGHSNLRLNFGPLTPVVVGPQYHRIHHSLLPQHQSKNFAQFFPIIDIIFGTYYRPKPDEYPPTGSPDLSPKASPVYTLIRPFDEWGKAVTRNLTSVVKKPNS